MVQQILPNGTTYSDYGVVTTNKQVTEKSPQTSTAPSRDRSPTPEILTRPWEEERQEEMAHFMSPSPRHEGHRFSRSDPPLSGSRLSQFLRDDAEVYSSDEDGEDRWSDSASIEPEVLSGPTLITDEFENSSANHFPTFLGTDANAPVTTTGHGDTPGGSWHVLCLVVLRLTTYGHRTIRQYVSAVYFAFVVCRVTFASA